MTRDPFEPMPPDLDVSIHLIDGVARAAQYPETFFVPPPEEIAQLQPGDLIKVGLESPDGTGERFWLQVISITGTGQAAAIVGTIQNLLVNYSFGLGDIIAVQPRHVLDIDEPPEITPWDLHPNRVLN